MIKIISQNIPYKKGWALECHLVAMSTLHTHQKKLGILGDLTDYKMGQGKGKKGLEYLVANKVRECSKSNRKDTGHRGPNLG